MGFPSNNAKSKPSIQKSTPPCMQLYTQDVNMGYTTYCACVCVYIYITWQVVKLDTMVLLHWARSFNSQMYIYLQTCL